MMSVPVNNVNRLIPGLIEQLGSTGTGTPGVSEETDKFSNILSNLVSSVNEIGQASGAAKQALMAGEDIELHDVMIKSEQAGIAMDLLLEIRNKLLSGYNEIMRMPM